MQTLNLKHQLTLPPELQQVPIVDIRGVLSVNPKYSWESLKGNRKLSDLTTIVLHHDAWPKKVSGSYSDTVLANKIAVDHINSKKNIPSGDAGFPYDAWIRNGTIYVCNDMLPLKYGVASNNSYTVHICLSGDYVNGDKMTDTDRNALYAAIYLYRTMMPAFSAIKAHKELSATSCPGYNYNKVRDDIAAIELHMSEHATYTESVPSNMVEAFAVVKRAEALWTNYNTDQWRTATEDKFMMLAEVTGCDTAKDIYYRIVDLYNKAQSGKWQGEAIRKLLLVSAVMKERGILQ